MNTKIVVDSSASLYTLQGVDFECVPLKIITDDAEYLDNGTMDALGMAQTLRTYKGKTSTSCPNVSDWLAAYEGADEVYAITITGTLSGSYNAAQLAAEEYQQENPGICWLRARSLTRSVKRCSATTSTPICSSRWNRWPIWPAMAA